MKEKFEDLNYELLELKKVLETFRYDMPEDVFKILYDLNYHSIKSLKELEETVRVECSKTRDNS